MSSVDFVVLASSGGEALERTLRAAVLAGGCVLLYRGDARYDAPAGMQVLAIDAGGAQTLTPGAAWNRAAAATTAPWICVLAIGAVPDPALPRTLTSGGVRLHSGGGVLACARTDLDAVGGFDSAFEGERAALLDLAGRLARAGRPVRAFPPGALIEPVPPGAPAAGPAGDRDRVYGAAVRDLQAIAGRRPEPPFRERLRAEADRLTGRSWHRGLGGDLHVQLGRDVGPDGHELTRTLHLHLDPTPDRWRPGEAASTPVPPSFARALEVIEHRWPGFRPESDEAPILILAAGQRSGSTLLQRMLMRKAWIWGEPWGRSGVLSNLALPFRTIGRDWPRPEFLAAGLAPDRDPSRAWIANLYPDLEDLVLATQANILTLLRDSARRRGARRWGLKEVRLDADDALFLRWLFPRCRIVMLVRDPYRAYASYRRFGRTWYRRWPAEPLDSPEAFGHQWRDLATSFRKQATALEALLLRYEDLAAPDFDAQALSTHLGVPIDRSAADHRIDGLPGGGARATGADRSELEALDLVVGEAAAEFGYGLPNAWAPR